MQRVLVIVVVFLLVTASLGVGALAAHWPFWRRAWAWHTAEGGWPQELPGPQAIVRGGGGSPLDFEAAGEDLAMVALKTDTQLLLRVRDGRADAWLAPGFEATTPIDGRGLAVALIEALFMRLEAAQSGLLDRPVGAWLAPWRQDARGAMSVRELLGQVAGGIDSPPAPAPLNPFSPRARLASGPGYGRAALLVHSPTDRDDRRAAAAQLLAMVAASMEGTRFTTVLEEWLWSEASAGDAWLTLDRRNGDAAAHCCIRAAAADWLRIGLALAGAAGNEVRVVRTRGRLLAFGAGGSLLWVGTGPAPSGLEMLLRANGVPGGGAALAAAVH